MSGFLNSGLTKIINEIKSIDPQPILTLARSKAVLGAGIGAAGGAGLAAIREEDFGGIVGGGFRGAIRGGIIGGAYGAYKGLRPQWGSIRAGIGATGSDVVDTAMAAATVSAGTAAPMSTALALVPGQGAISGNVISRHNMAEELRAANRAKAAMMLKPTAINNSNYNKVLL